MQWGVNPSPLNPPPQIQLSMEDVKEDDVYVNCMIVSGNQRRQTTETVYTIVRFGSVNMVDNSRDKMGGKTVPHMFFSAK